MGDSTREHQQVHQQKLFALQRKYFQTWKEQVLCVLIDDCSNIAKAILHGQPPVQIRSGCDKTKSIIMDTAMEWMDVQTAVLMQSFSLAWRASMQDTQTSLEMSFVILAWRNEARIGCRERNASLLFGIGRESGLAQTVLLHWRYQAHAAQTSRKLEQLRHQLHSHPHDSGEMEELRQQVHAPRDDIERIPIHSIDVINSKMPCGTLRISKRFLEGLLDRLREDIFGGTFTAWKHLVHAIGKPCIRDHALHHSTGGQVDKISLEDHALNVLDKCFTKQNLWSYVPLLYAWHEILVQKRRVRLVEQCTDKTRTDLRNNVLRFVHTCLTKQILSTYAQMLYAWRELALEKRVVRSMEQCTEKVKVALKDNVLSFVSTCLAKHYSLSHAQLLHAWHERVVEMRRVRFVDQPTESIRLHPLAKAARCERMAALLVRHRRGTCLHSTIETWRSITREAWRARYCEKLKQVERTRQCTSSALLNCCSIRFSHSQRVIAQLLVRGWRQQVEASHKERSWNKQRNNVTDVHALHKLAALRTRCSCASMRRTFSSWCIESRSRHMERIVCEVRTQNKNAAQHRIQKVLSASIRRTVYAEMRCTFSTWREIAMAKNLTSHRQMSRARTRICMETLMGEPTSSSQYIFLQDVFLIWLRAKHEALVAQYKMAVRDEQVVFDAKIRHRAIHVINTQSVLHDSVLLENSVQSWRMWMIWQNELRQLGRHVQLARKGMATELSSRRLHARLCFLFSVWRGQMLKSRGVMTCREMEVHLHQKFNMHVLYVAEKCFTRNSICLLSMIVKRWCSWLLQTKFESSHQASRSHAKQQLGRFVACSVDLCNDSFLRAFILLWKIILSWQRTSYSEVLQCQTLQFQQAHLKRRDCYLLSRMCIAYMMSTMLSVLLAWRMLTARVHLTRQMEEQCQRLLQLAQRTNVMLKDSRQHSKLMKIWVQWKELVLVARNMHGMVQQVEHVKHRTEKQTTGIVSHFAKCLQIELLHLVFLAWRNLVSWEQRLHCLEQNFQSTLLKCDELEKHNFRMHSVANRTSSLASSIKSAWLMDFVFQLWQRESARSHQIAQSSYLEQRAREALRKSTMTKNFYRDRTALCDATRAWHDIIQYRHVEVSVEASRSIRERIHVVERNVASLLFHSQLHALVEVVFLLWLMLVLDAHLRQQMEEREQSVCLLLQQVVLAFDARHSHASVRVAWMQWIDFLAQARMMHGSTQLQDLKNREMHLLTQISSTARRPILKCVVTLWRAKVSQQFCQWIGLQSDKMRERFRDIAYAIVTRLATLRNSYIAQVAFAVWHENVVEQVWVNDTAKLQRQLLHDKSNHRDSALSLLAIGDKQQALACMQHALLKWRLHTMQIGFDDEMAFLKARWCDTASTTIGNLVVVRESSCKLMVLWAWKGFVVNAVDKMLAHDVRAMQREARVMNMCARSAVFSLCTAVVLAALLYWERMTKYNRAKAASAAMTWISELKSSLWHLSAKRHGRTRLRCALLAWTCYLLQMKSGKIDLRMLWHLRGKQEKRTILRCVLLVWTCYFKDGFLDNNREHVARLHDQWQQNATRVARRLATAELMSVVRGSMLIWWLVAQGAQVSKLKCLQQQCCHVYSVNALSLLEPSNLPSNGQLQHLFQTGSRIVHTIMGGIGIAAFTEWRIVTLSRKQITQALLLRRGAKVVSRALDWRKTNHMMSLNDIVFGSWRHYCTQLRCDRQMQLLVEEKEAMQRELSYFRNGTDKYQRKAMAIIEQSMSAASVLQTLDMEQSQLALQDSS